MRSNKQPTLKQLKDADIRARKKFKYFTETNRPEFTVKQGDYVDIWCGKGLVLGFKTHLRRNNKTEWACYICPVNYWMPHVNAPIGIVNTNEVETYFNDSDIFAAKL